MGDASLPETWQDKVAGVRAHRDASLAKVQPALEGVPAEGSMPLYTRDLPGKILTAREIEITEGYSITKLLAAMKSREISVEEVTRAFLRRAAIAHAATNCLTELLWDQAVERAKHLDSLAEAKGMLFGLPISTKEHQGMVGSKVTSNSSFVAWIGKEHGSNLLYDCLWAEGCVFYARTNQPQAIMHLETDNPVYGRTLNPYNRNLSPGGSTGGESALMGMRGSILGIGGDIGGSIRVPAAHVGLYGFKATWKRLSARGLLAPAAGKETMGASPGPLAADRDALDLFMRVALAAKPWRIDPSVVEMPWRPYDEFAKGRRRLKVAVQWWDGVVQPHPPMTRALREVAGACRRAGIEVVDWDCEHLDHQRAWDIVSALYWPDGGKEVMDLLEQGGEPMLPLTKFIIQEQPTVGSLTQHELWKLCLERDNYRSMYAQAWSATGKDEDDEVDVILCPPNFGAATPHDQSKYWGYTSHWNLVDYPAVVFPVTTVDPVKDVKDASYTPKNAQDRFVYDMYTPDKFANAPVSLQIVGRRFHDEKVLAALVEIERAIDLLHLSKDQRHNSTFIMADEESKPLPPGTVRLVDSSSQSDLDSKSDLILVPAPSEDPEDPLNWSRRRKMLATSCIVVYTMVIALPSSAVYSIVTPIRAETGLTLTDINNGTGIMFLFYGWGCVFWQAVALQWGKRPVYLFSLLANVVILATAPLCTSSGTYLANRIILGFFGSPVESLAEVSVTDLWFAHERPTYMAWYGWSLAMTGKLAPMLSGFINVGMGWQWTLWWCSIWNAMGFVYCFLLMEETNYDRKHTHGAQAAASQTAATDASSSSSPATPTEKKPVDDAAAAAAKKATDSQVGELVWPRKSLWNKLSLRDKKRPMRFWDVFWAPFVGFSYPAVVYAGFMYGANSLVWQGVQNATIGTIYTTRYGFSTAGVAAAYAGGVLGSVIGGLYAGKVGQMLTVRLARRNGGVAESENILYLFAAGVVLVPFALVLYGVAVTYHLHWFALATTQFALAITASFCIPGALGYAMSSYPELSSQLVTTCVLIRNTLSFAINYGITPWLNHNGYLAVYCIVGAIGLLWNASCFVMIRYGRRIREWTAPRYYRDVQRARAKGLGH
ncbi:hypothetical protein MCOR02_012179 [Pyricularia oryzae]|nr:hypothetical protein MCOR02_012179 [Pyricularia oryzae]KAI6487804.1 hypothetical protein MCOR13_009139 [Pyricularia oryzae]KAI6562674.1 hypothetical protein MCOR04_009318 [Pyricularia oryzae]